MSAWRNRLDAYSAQLPLIAALYAALLYYQEPVAGLVVLLFGGVGVGAAIRLRQLPGSRLPSAREAILWVLVFAAVYLPLGETPHGLLVAVWLGGLGAWSPAARADGLGETRAEDPATVPSRTEVRTSEGETAAPTVAEAELPKQNVTRSERATRIAGRRAEPSTESRLRLVAAIAQACRDGDEVGASAGLRREQSAEPTSEFAARLRREQSTLGASSAPFERLRALPTTGSTRSDGIGSEALARLVGAIGNLPTEVPELRLGRAEAAVER